MGHGLGVDFTHKTVGDAFHALATEWECFKCQPGSGTKNGANKRLVAAGDDVPDALWQLHRTETGEEATGRHAFAENSESTNGGR